MLHRMQDLRIDRMGALRRLWYAVCHLDMALSLPQRLPLRLVVAVIVGLTPAGLALWAVPPWGVALLAVVGLSGSSWAVLGIIVLRDSVDWPRRRDIYGPELRVTLMQGLLDQAADGIAKRAAASSGNAEASRMFWWYMDRVFTFLQFGFVEPRDGDLSRLLEADKDRLGTAFDPASSISSYLKRLRHEISEKDVHGGCVLPITFDQFVDHEGNWPKNIPTAA